MKIELVNSEVAENLICEPVVLEEALEMKRLGEEMIKFCLDVGGIGLAAPQIGVAKRMFVWANTDSTFEIVFNPRYFAKNKKTTNVVEACLTYPNRQFYVKRAKWIRALYEKYDEEKNKLVLFNKLFSFEKSIIFQHETNHLVYLEDLQKNATIAITGIEVTQK